MFKICVIDKEGHISEALKKHFSSNAEIIESNEICDNGYDLIITNDYNAQIKNIKTKILNIHPSLLPAFDGENSLQNSFVSGIKVGGITIQLLGQNPTENKIIAQYPVLIGLETHFDEFKQDIIDTEKRLVPVVAEATLHDKIFDFHDLFKTSCHHSKNHCSNCGKCSN